MNGYPVKLNKSLALRHSLFDKNRIEVLHIRQAYKFVDCGVIPYVAFNVGVSLAPLLCRCTEHRHIQHVGFVGVNDACLCRSNLRRDKVMLYGVSVYTG